MKPGRLSRRVALSLSLAMPLAALFALAGCDEPPSSAHSIDPPSKAADPVKPDKVTKKAPANPTKAPAEPRKPPIRDISFDTVKFDIEPDGAFERDMLTPTIEELIDKRVRVRGWIQPISVFSQTGITEFVFVRDNLECCFGPGAAIYDCMLVEMHEDHSTDFTTRPIAVEGTFVIEPIEDEDRLWVLYRLKNAVVR